MSDNKTKSVFIIPPKWYCLNPPSFMVPTVSCLRNIGYETKMFDFNIDYYVSVLDKKYLQNSVKEAEAQMPELFEYLRKNYSQGKSQGEYDNDFKAKLLRYNKIKELTKEKKDKVQEAINSVEHSLKVMRDKKLFYNPIEFTSAFANLDFCLELASLPYFPAKIQIRTYNDPFFKLEFNDMVKSATTKNMFTSFYENNLYKITKSNPDVIGIAIDATTQIVSALTLCVMLKEKTNAKILVCGNFFTRLTDVVKKYPDFFKYFCDYIVPDEVEMPTLPKLFDYFEGKVSIDEVPNILYLKDGKVIENEQCKPIHLNEHPAWDISDFEFEKYPTPSIVMPVLSSRGCYWGKCSFCDHSFGQKMDIKPVSQFVDELEELHKKHGIKYFELIDECISPQYLYNMSKEILKRKLEIYWFNYARLETEFTEEILTTASKAGCKMLLWGVESGSRKVMEDINKGIDLDKRDEILRASRKAGIWNFAFIFFGFPTETVEDANMTIDYIKNNTDFLSSYGKSMFTFGKHTTLNRHPEKFGITKIYKDKEEFSPRLHFETSKGMSKKELEDVSYKCLLECRKAYNNPLWMYLIYREILFLYICKLGIDKVESMTVEQSGNFTDEECANGTVDIWRQSKSL